MYNWRQNEEITAAKLNAMQTRPQMEAINRSGIGIGGLDDSALSSDVIDSDGGTWSTVVPKQVIITEHEVGNLKYEYDTGSEGWKLRTGRAGTTGKPQVAAGELKWLCKSDLPNDAKKYVWQKINTDSYGNPVTIATCINTNPSMQTNTWDPATGTTGTIWRRLASIEPNTDITCEVSCKNPWAMKAINENNAFMLPIARRYGSLQGWGNINLKEDADVKDRGSSSHWAPVMYGEGGMSNLIQSIGELGGTFVYQTKEGCGSDNDYGIGIASGIEFYDDISIRECYNRHEMRPKPTRACAPLGPDGKYGKIIIQSVNPKHPWQFQLSADFDIGSGGGWDPGSHWIDCIPLADGPICGTRSYYGWGGRYDQPPGLADMKHGLIDGSVTRLTNQDILWTGQFRSWCATYRPGEINCGGIGIGTAQFQWVSEFKKDDPFDGCVTSNRNGGLVTGIMNDSPCRYYIDQNGFIHAPDPEWMGEHGVKLPCANTELKNTVGGTGGAYPYYLWPAFDKSKWCHTQPQYNDGGRVSGEIVVMKPNISTKQDTPQVYPDGNGNQYLWPQMGQVKEGVIGIPNAFFKPYACVEGNETVDVQDWLKANDMVYLQYKWSPGVIRGVMDDIEWQWLYLNKNDEYVYPEEGEDWPADNLPDCVAMVEYFPSEGSYIDENGILHLPMMYFLSQKETFTCCGNKKTRLVNFEPETPPIYYKIPQDAPAGPNQPSDENQGEEGGEGGEINPGSGVGGGGGYVPVPIP